MELEASTTACFEDNDAVPWLVMVTVCCAIAHVKHFVNDVSGAFMILAASFEFWKRHNAEIVERPTDDDEVRQVSGKCAYGQS